MKKSGIVSLALLAGIGLHGNARASTQLTYNDFSSTSGYTLYGGAEQSGSALQLSMKDKARTIGSVFFSTPVDVTSFNSSFSFTFSGSGGSHTDADGMVFVIKNIESANFGANGGAIGYGGAVIQGTEQPGITNSVGIEFDSWNNPERGDIDGNHIGINTDGISNSVVESSVSTLFNGSPASTWYAWVDYDGTIMSVYLSKENNKPELAAITYGTTTQPFDVSKEIGSSTALVGFTAATGGVSQTTVLNSFNHYSPNPEPSTYLLMGIGALIAGLAGRRRLGGMSTE